MTPGREGRPVSPVNSGSAGLGDHGGAHRGVGALVDQDEAAGGAVPGVGIAEDGLGEAEPDPADLVQAQLGGGLVNTGSLCYTTLQDANSIYCKAFNRDPATGATSTMTTDPAMISQPICDAV